MSSRSMSHPQSILIAIVLLLPCFFAPQRTFLPVTGRSDAGDISSALPASAPSGQSTKSISFRDSLPLRVDVPELFALTVEQQPANSAGYVASRPGVVTQFSLASNSGAVGLLAHNTFAGALFFSMHPSQRVVLSLANGIKRYYRISTIDQYQALQPASPYSDFLDLQAPGSPLSAGQVFQKIYQHPDWLIFQTCIARNGNVSWGRLFITAVPDEEYARISVTGRYRNSITY